MFTKLMYIFFSISRDLPSIGDGLDRNGKRRFCESTNRTIFAFQFLLSSINFGTVVHLIVYLLIHAYMHCIATHETSPIVGHSPLSSGLAQPLTSQFVDLLSSMSSVLSHWV